MNAENLRLRHTFGHSEFLPLASFFAVPAGTALTSTIPVVTMMLPHRNRGRFDKYVFNQLTASIIALTAAELPFTFYVSVYWISNIIGKILKVVSFYFLCRAIVETGIIKPLGSYSGT